VSLADVLLTSLKRDCASLELVPGKGGCFEVDVDGTRVWSKLETGQFPDESDLLLRITKRTK
jgi:selenoprotein W-related protein